MNRVTKKTMLAAIILSSVILIIWQITGGDFYTKYQVVEEIEKKLDQSDPLLAAGFYGNSTITETIVKNEFRFGLLPTASGIFDKHTIAVTTILTPLWSAVIILQFIWRKKR
ncbi:MAG: hypothetical protein DRP51_10425 [Candidatus Zixiibacteriota bacterium]|nr:MAG: hypothetical protein DRP51_10425 [candidate division Zixibacteria bacterium]HHI03422.1 hypothetical protein [candidate division Zixibacteria bacterium]